MIANPSVGMCAETGRRRTGWQHVEQSLSDIFTTSFGTRVMREFYGSFVPALLGRNLTPRDVTPFFAAVTSAVEQWEPRFRVTQIEIVGISADGGLKFFLAGEYRPRAMFGDFTVEGARRLDAYANNDGILIDRRASA